MNHATIVQTKTCGPAIKMLKIPITEPSVPFLIYLESIANGNASKLAQPIPASPISAKTIFVFVVKAMPKNAKTIVKREII